MRSLHLGQSEEVLGKLKSEHISLEVMQKLKIVPCLMAGLTALFVTSCSTATTEEYSATALTSYTWQVKYANNLTSEPRPRIETFATASVLNRNGLKPAGAVVGPDDQGLWWPTLRPRPSVDEIEQRKKPTEEAGKPELIKDVQYQITYGIGDAQKTLPTNARRLSASGESIPVENSFAINFGGG